MSRREQLQEFLLKASDEIARRARASSLSTPEQSTAMGLGWLCDQIDELETRLVLRERNNHPPIDLKVPMPPPCEHEWRVEKTEDYARVRCIKCNRQAPAGALPPPIQWGAPKQLNSVCNARSTDGHWVCVLARGHTGEHKAGPHDFGPKEPR